MGEGGVPNQGGGGTSGKGSNRTSRGLSWQASWARNAGSLVVVGYTSVPCRLRFCTSHFCPFALVILFTNSLTHSLNSLTLLTLTPPSLTTNRRHVYAAAHFVAAAVAGGVGGGGEGVGGDNVQNWQHVRPTQRHVRTGWFDTHLIVSAWRNRCCQPTQPLTTFRTTGSVSPGK